MARQTKGKKNKDALGDYGLYLGAVVKLLSCWSVHLLVLNFKSRKGLGFSGTKHEKFGSERAELGPD